MSDTPLFSVVVPTFDRPDLLAEALASVERQTIRDLECIVVDDGGTLPVEVPDDPRFRLVRRSGNGGLSAARNTGLGEASGRYVTLLDDDDLLAPDRLEIAVEGLAHAPAAICWRGNVHDGSAGRNRPLDGNVHDRILDDAVPHVGQAAIERPLIPLFDEDLLAAEEIDWWLRLTEEISVRTVPRIGYLYRTHGGPRHLNGLEARVKYRQVVLERYRPYFETHRRAAAFQWKRIGLLSLAAGNPVDARGAFARAMWKLPQPATAWHLARSLVRRRTMEVAR